MMTTFIKWLHGLWFDKVKWVVRHYVDKVEMVPPNAIYDGIRFLRQAGAGRLSRRQFNRAVWIIELLTQRHPNWLPELLDNNELYDFLRWCDRCDVWISSGADTAFAIAIFKEKVELLLIEPDEE